MTTKFEQQEHNGAMITTPFVFTPPRFHDHRGWFAESYSFRKYSELGIADHFVQDNHSYSEKRGTVRGLHFQAPPSAQAKLIECTAGSIWDVAVDIREGSPTFGRWTGVELSSANGSQFYIPLGYAHGFITLTDHVEVIYKTSSYYDPLNDRGIFWNDPNLGIEWPVLDVSPILSAKDKALPSLKAIQSPFIFVN